MSNHISINGKQLIFNNKYLSYFTWDSDAQTLVNRMITAGENPTYTRQMAINDCITSLKSNNLYNTQFDVLIVTKGTGLTSTKMNWIKNVNNALAVGTPTFTTDIGYWGTNAANYLRTQYIPSTDASLFKQNDACFGFIHIGSDTDYNYGIHGGYPTSGTYGAIDIGSGTIQRLNSSPATGSSLKVGYNCLTRSDSTKYTQLTNSSTVDYTAASKPISNEELYMLCANWQGTPSYPLQTNQGITAYWLGKSITQAQFITFQGIMNTYFATF
jgi:hypothetical protein